MIVALRSLKTVLRRLGGIAAISSYPLREQKILNHLKAKVCLMPLKAPNANAQQRMTGRKLFFEIR